MEQLYIIEFKNEATTFYEVMTEGNLLMDDPEDYSTVKIYKVGALKPVSFKKEITLSEIKQKVTGKHKPHKKHAYKKECEDCGKSFKGLQGLGIHRATKHK